MYAVQRFSATDFRAYQVRSETGCLPSARPRDSATNPVKSLRNRVPNLCQSCVNLCVFVCILCNGGALRRITSNRVKQLETENLIGECSSIAPNPVLSLLNDNVEKVVIQTL